MEWLESITIGVFSMVAYHVEYEVRGKAFTADVDAKDAKSMKRKLGKKHGYKDGRMIKVNKSTVVGYY